MLQKTCADCWADAVCVACYAGTERTDTKKLINITNEQGLDASFYVAQFHYIHHAQSKDKLIKHTQNTLVKLEQAQSVFNNKNLYTPAAKQVRDDYNQGIYTLKDALNTLKTTKNPDLDRTKKQITKAGQQLLNSREKLFNLADRHLMTMHLKM